MGVRSSVVGSLERYLPTTITKLFHLRFFRGIFHISAKWNTSAPRSYIVLTFPAIVSSLERNPGKRHMARELVIHKSIEKIGAFKIDRRGRGVFFSTGDGCRLNARNTRRMANIPRALDDASRPEDMNLPGVRFHRQQKPLCRGRQRRLADHVRLGRGRRRRCRWKTITEDELGRARRRRSPRSLMAGDGGGCT
jgi:hypothetical protein